MLFAWNFRISEFLIKKWEGQLDENNLTPELGGRWSNYLDIYQIYRDSYVCRSDISVWDCFMNSEY